MPNALNHNLITIRNRIVNFGISSVTEDELLNFIAHPIVKRYDSEPERTGYGYAREVRLPILRAIGCGDVSDICDESYGDKFDEENSDYCW